MKHGWWMAAVLVAAVFLVAPRGADSCGPFFEDAMFTTYHHALPGELASGQLGVLRPHFYRSDLLLAYRALSGVPVGGAPAAAEPAQVAPASERWLQARKTVPGVQAIDRIDVDKGVPGQDYQVFLNCLDGAFDAAAATLRERVAKFGAGSAQTAEWVRAQDQVFENCSGGAAIPPELPSADPLLAADRRYQIAAAKFYAEKYEEAETDFDAIAHDGASPWHGIAPYLAARACIRQGTIRGKEDALRSAAARLRAILKDPSRSQWHAAAQGLLDFVRAHLEPDARLAELGNQLTEPASPSQLERVVTDYTSIWDRLEAANRKPAAEHSDVADWIETFQKGGDAMGKWRAKHTLPWLVAALSRGDPAGAGARDLVAAVHSLRPDSPAYASATYYGILLQIKAGEFDAARTWADQALAGKLPDSAANLVRAERLRLARDWKEFLRFAPRKPVAEGSDDLGWEQPVSDENAKKKPAAFDGDSEQALNHLVPLRLWMEAANSDLVPRGLQSDIAQAAWVRAIILGDQPAARTLAERVRQLQPELAAGMRDYLAEKDPATANFAAVFLMLRGPGLRPLVRPGFGREEASVLKREMFRDNWWMISDTQAKPDSESANHEALYDLYPDGNFGPKEFLTKDQREAGDQEWTRLLDKAANSVNYLCTEAIAWARSHPQDPRVPEALHLAVEATHYGPSDESSRPYSKQAFDLLHRRYPDSEWTKKTKYWY